MKVNFLRFLKKTLEISTNKYSELIILVNFENCHIFPVNLTFFREKSRIFMKNLESFFNFPRKTRNFL